MKLTIAEIVRACNGKLLSGDPQTEITSVSTDSRKISPGTLFVPIRGERVDAHMYIPAVFAAGAAATLTQNHTAVADDEQARIAVESTERALQEIASYYRERFSIPIIGITGSVGKTTTKEMVALALSSQWNTMKTSGNQNSQIGLPLTLFQLEHEHEAAVIEMGMSYPGEMANLAKIARPMHAVITNIGLSHIENLGSQERILAEKLHITDAFTQDSILYLNGDDVHLAALREQLPQVRKIYTLTDTVLPGKSMECTYEAAANEKVAFATMFGYSNDWFFANGPELNALTKGEVTNKTVLLDDGTAVSQYPGAGNAQFVFGGTRMPEDKAISAVGDTFPVPAVDGIVKITIY